MNIRQKIFQSAAYLTYWLQAMSEHSLHPPYIYKLYTQALKEGPVDPVFNAIENYRDRYLKSKQVITITDLGAGSGVSSAKKRTVKSIARNSLSNAHFSRLLFRLIRYQGAANILELGTSLGINTLYLSAAIPSGKIYTLEGCPQTVGIAGELFTEWPKKNIQLLEGNINTTLPQMLQQCFQDKKVDGVYLDANHTYDATKAYFELILPYLHENSFFVLDDIYWSKEMYTAWKEISSHPLVSLSIDLFDAGILMFQSGIRKEHYILEC